MAVMELPSGTVTFLFTDLEGRRVCGTGARCDARGAGASRRDPAQDAIEHARRPDGEDDVATACMRCSRPRTARSSSAVDAQLAIGRQAWETSEPLKVRIGMSYR